MKLSLAHSKSFNNLIISALISLIILICAVFSDITFPLLSLERIKVDNGEAWRILSSNLVHFGWPHTLMNLAAFQIASFILFKSVSPTRFVILVLLCNLSVGLGIYNLNPEYGIYAGFSGSIHGLLIAGLVLNKRHVYWMNVIFIVLVFSKIFYEHRPDYKATDLQDLLPVPVAYDAHLYGALAGLVFGIFALLIDRYSSQSKRA